MLTNGTGMVVRRLTTRPTLREVTFTGLLRASTYRVAVTAANQVGTSPATRAVVRTTR